MTMIASKETGAEGREAQEVAGGVPTPVFGDGDGLDRSWMDEANCLGVDPDLFFPERGGDVRAAKAVCHGCVVKAACLDFAMAAGERFGIWGGTSERERRQMRRVGWSS